MSYQIITFLKSSKEVFLKKDIFQIFLILLLFLIIKFFTLKITNVGEDIFHSESYLIQFFSKRLNILFFLIYCFIFYLTRNISWKNYQKSFKLLWLFTSLIIVYKFGFNSYNYYYDNYFFYERILLVFLFILSYWEIKFITPLIFLFQLTLSQYHYPIGGYSFTDLWPLINFFPLILTFLVLNQTLKVKLINFWRVFIAFQFSYYFFPGLSKLEIAPNYIEWILYNDLSNLFRSSVEMGWLNFMDENFINTIYNFIRKLKFPLNIFTVLLELSSILFLGNLKLLRIYLALTILLHLGIVFASGIFFWKWIGLNTIVILLSYLNEEKSCFREIFQVNKYYLLVIVLISPLFTRPLSLGWFDTKIVEKYEFFVTDINNNEHQVTGNFFKPYDKIFSQNRFNFIDFETHYVGTYGSLGFDKHFFSDFNPKDLLTGKTNFSKSDYNNYLLTQDLDFDKLRGKNFYNKEKKSKLINFLDTYFENYNKNPDLMSSVTIPHIIQVNNFIPDKIIAYKVNYVLIYHKENDRVLKMNKTIIDKKIQ